MKLSELVTATGQVAATSSRLAKIDALATLLQSAEPDELAPVVGLLLATPRQGRLGVGWRGISAVEVTPAETASLTIDDIDRAFDELAALSGSGSAAARSAALTACRRNIPVASPTTSTWRSPIVEVASSTRRR